MSALGCHLSVSQGFAAMGKTALSIGANTFQFFTRNPRGSRAKDIDKADADALGELMKKHDFAPIVAHAPYTLNPCSKDENTRMFAIETMADDLKRLSATPCRLYNFHPGSHVGQGTEKGTELIADALNSVLTADEETTVLLETMAGKGSEVGSSFEQLCAVIKKVKLSDKVGVCFDTCHVYDAGYDIVNDLDGGAGGI